MPASSLVKQRSGKVKPLTVRSHKTFLAGLRAKIETEYVSKSNLSLYEVAPAEADIESAGPGKGPDLNTLLTTVLDTEKTHSAALWDKSDIEELHALFRQTRDNVTSYFEVIKGAKKTLQSIRRKMIRCEKGIETSPFKTRR